MKKTTISILIASILSGCASGVIDKMESKVDDKRILAETSLQDMKPKLQEDVLYSEKSYVPMKMIKASEHNLQQRQLLSTEISINKTFDNLNEIASWLSYITNSSVSLNPELIGTAGSSSSGATPSPMPPSMSAPMSSLMSMASSSGVAAKPFNVTYSGSINGFLDMVCASYGIYWKLEDRNLRFFQTDSRTFRIKALPGDTQLSSSVGASASTSGGGSSGGASTSTTQGSSVNSTSVSFSGMSVWVGIETAIKQLLTTGTGKVAVSPATGTVSVTDTPRVLDKVEEFIKQQNISLGRQVSVNVRVLTVEINDKDNYGINWTAVYSNLARNASFQMNTGFTPIQGAANFILQTATPSANNWGAASGAVISALSTQGRVSELTSSTVVTLNNQPAPVNVGRQVSYLSSAATTTSTTGTTTTLTPGQVQTGFSMVIIPHILDGKELLLQSSLNLSSLLQLSSISSGGQTIQSPDLSTSNFIQRVKMNSGDLLVVAGFDQDNLSAVSNGVGAASNSLMGSKNANGKRSMIVIIMQPTVSK